MKAELTHSRVILSSIIHDKCCGTIVIICHMAVYSCREVRYLHSYTEAQDTV